MGSEFKDQLQRAISLAGLTQKQLAEKAGITEAAVSHYLKGDRTPRAAVVSKLADVLGCSLEFLLGAKKEDGTMDFESLYNMVARNADQLSDEKKNILIALLVKNHLPKGDV